MTCKSCGMKNAAFSPVSGSCGGLGVVECMCGGDLCVCHNHGEVYCYGCEDCEAAEDDGACFTHSRVE